MVAQAHFTETGLTIAPGDEATASLTVMNLGDRAETYSMLPSGLSAAWVQITPPTLTILPGSSEQAMVTMRPPRQASTIAGSMAVTARAVAQTDPDVVATADLPITVQTYDDRRVHVLQPVQRGRSRARFDIVIENQGNAHASCRLHLIDPTGRVDGLFDPPSLGIEPGANALAQLRVRGVGRPWRRAPRFLPFRVEAAQQGHETVATEATFVQTPLIGERFWPRLAAAGAALLVAIVGWFAVVRPAIDDAASDAVAEQITAAGVTSSVPFDGTPPGGSTVTSNSTAAGDVPAAGGELFTTRLAKDVPLGAADGSVYTVPAGFALRVTDVILQNPAPDTGRAVLLRNSDVIFEWALGNVFGNEPLPIVTPMEFPAGDNLTFQITCAGFGDLARGACTASLTLIGRLVPV